MHEDRHAPYLVYRGECRLRRQAGTRGLHIHLGIETRVRCSRATDEVKDEGSALTAGQVQDKSARLSSAPGIVRSDFDAFCCGA
jgi:hypothetical protein